MIRVPSVSWPFVRALYEGICGTHLQEGRFLQHAEEFREEVAHLLVHGPHQANLPHCAGSVRAVAVGSLHLPARREQIGGRCTGGQRGGH